MANMVAIAIGACLAALGLLAAISAGLPDWAYVAYDFTGKDWYGHSVGVKSEYTIGLYKANRHQAIEALQTSSCSDGSKIGSVAPVASICLVYCRRIAECAAHWP